MENNVWWQREPLEPGHSFLTSSMMHSVDEGMHALEEGGMTKAPTRSKKHPTSNCQQQQQQQRQHEQSREQRREPLDQRDCKDEAAGRHRLPIWCAVTSGWAG